MSELNPRCRVPHIMRNEDGKEYRHPGYEYRRCQRCRELFICAVTWVGTMCGWPKCNVE